MKADPDKTYVFRFTDTDGNQRWSRPKKIGECNSMNVEWDTIEQMAMFVAQFYYPYQVNIVSYEAFEIPDWPVEANTY